ncbi:DEKNAAC105632 [Brettanomyces naardenensis]|uniref:DEKNAAC105632 n=1 Tax=Brettanomyces naardenensis TaxID=13370 RepID=A0A448YTM8_BRENA|nr:DEKNAAC105632 [Brettanomyces naardenensis]
MGRVQKKNAKGRLDRYYYLAKEKGYRARSSFKILQINEKYGHFLEKSKVVVDLCAAPGSWCQVASELCPVNSLIVGVDIVQMKPIPKCITFQSDITTEDCRSQLRGYLKTWKADTVLHDGAPNVGLNWIQDAYTQSQLTLEALRLAVEHLTPGGTFVTKVFRSKDYNNLIWVFKQLFDRVEATKPPASRNVSAEIFVVCKNFKAPKKLDPRFLDLKAVFEELPEGPQNNESKVFNPELKKRKRQGYEEGDWTHFHPMKIMDWVRQEDDVINTLGTVSSFEIDTEDPEWKILKAMKRTTKEFFECCKDLQVLGKKDFRMLLRWRKHAREELGLLEKKDKEIKKPQIEVEELTEDQRIDKELDEMKEKEKLAIRREKRRKNEMKQKESQRLQMNMLTDMQIGIDAAQNGSESLFSLKAAEKTGELSDLAKGKRAIVFETQRKENKDVNTDIIEMEDSEEQADNLEEQLDTMYERYRENKLERDAKLKAKIARGDEDDAAWDGINDTEEVGPDSSDEEFEEEDESDSAIDSDDDEAINNLIANMKENKKKGELSGNAARFFSGSIFQDIDMNIAPTSGSKRQQTKQIQVALPGSQEAKKDKEKEKKSKKEKKGEAFDNSSDESSSKGDGGFEVVPNDYSEQFSDDGLDYDTDSDEERNIQRHKEDIDISSVEAMTLAHDLAVGKKSKSDIMNEGFNKYSFRDKEGVPAWFVEDENQHNKINRPITKEASTALKEKMKLLNARPIKKVMEAQARKKMRAARRLEKIKKKSEMILEDGTKTESDKASEIQRMMKKMTKKQERPKVTMVVARGSNRGLKGRPHGVRGKYKMVDGVMKNEMRALKRIEKRNKKHKKH